MSGRCTKLHSEHFAMKEKILNENIVVKDLKLNYNFLPLCIQSHCVVHSHQQFLGATHLYLTTTVAHSDKIK